MKQLTLLIILVMITAVSLSQNPENEQHIKKIRLQISTDLYSDRWMQWEQYIDGGKSNYPEANDIIPGFTIEFYKPTSLKNINYLIGTTFLRYNNKVGGNLSYKSIHENQLTGGGAFIGAEFSPQYKVIGFSIKMAVGYFNMSRTIIRYSANPLDIYSVEKNISSGSLTNILQASLNLKFGRISLIPSAKLIFAGGNQMSVIAPGISLGAGYIFK